MATNRKSDSLKRTLRLEQQVSELLFIFLIFFKGETKRKWTDGVVNLATKPKWAWFIFSCPLQKVFPIETRRFVTSADRVTRRPSPSPLCFNLKSFAESQI